METAYEDSIERALAFMELRSVFLATGVSGLFHLFERQLLKHLNHELRDWLVEEITDWDNARSVLEKLKFKSVHRQLFDSTEIQHALGDLDHHGTSIGGKFGEAWSRALVRSTAGNESRCRERGPT